MEQQQQQHTWLPNAVTLDKVLRTLREVNNPAFVQQVQASISELKGEAEWPFYLSYILCECTREPIEAQCFAGVLLKQYVSSHWSAERAPQVNSMVVGAVKKAVLASLASQIREVRRSGASLVATIFDRNGIGSWPELLPMLSSSLTTAPEYVVDGVLYTLTLVFEDQAHHLDDGTPSAPLVYLVPQLINVLGNLQINEQARYYALICFDYVLTSFTKCLSDNKDGLLRVLTVNAQNGGSERVRTAACRCLVTMTESAESVIAPIVDDLMRFFLSCMGPGGLDGIILEVCRFWRTACMSENLRAKVESVLPQLLPLLLDRMVFSKSEIEAIHADEQANLSSSLNGGSMRPSGGGNGEDDDDDDDIGDDDEAGSFADDDIMDESESNSVRRSAAATLDDIACTFGDQILPIVIPGIEARMQVTDPSQWPVLEAAILAIGAIGNGCMSGLSPYMPRVLPYLIEAMGNSQPSIRGTAAWTGSRFSNLMLGQFEQAQSVEDAKRTLLCSYIQRLMTLLQDPINKVFNYSCTALTDLIDAAGDRIAPFTSAILEALSRVFPTRGTSAPLFDVISALAEAVGTGLANPSHICVLMPMVMQRWNATTDDDQTLSAVLCCMRCVLCSIRESFQPYAEHVFNKCVHFIGVSSSCCQQYFEYQQNRDSESEDGEPTIKMSNQKFRYQEDILISSLNLIGEMCACFGSSMDTLVAPSNLVSLLSGVVDLPSPPIRRAALGLLGDLATACMSCIQQALPAIVTLLERNLNPSFPSVATNAAWAIGQIVVRNSSCLQPVLPSVLEKLMTLFCMQAPPSEPGLPYNASISTGRLALAFPPQVSARVSAVNIFPVWCKRLSDLQEGEEQRDSISGLCTVCMTCPEQVAPMFSYALLAFASCTLTPPLRSKIEQVMNGFRTALGAKWNEIVNMLPQEAKASLAKKFSS